MSSMRVTPRMMAQRSLNNLTDQVRKLLKLQDQLSSQQRIGAPSDDPIGTQRAVNIRSILSKNTQYGANIDSAGPLLTETETAITTVNTTLGRIRELTLQAANSTNAQAQLSAISNEVNQLLENVFSTGNHITDGRYIFAGTRSSQPAFTATRNANGEITSVTFQGNTDTIDISTGDNIRVVINENGQNVFVDGQDLFQTLIDIRDNMRAGDTEALRSTSIAQLDTSRNQMLTALSRVGAVQNRLSSSQTEIEDFTLGYQELLSDTVDIDFAEVMIDLNSQSNAYQAALSAASRVMQPSLLDFIQ